MPPNPLKPEQAEAKALRWLARREYSRVELQARLCREGLDSRLAGELVEHLREQGWQSDRRFAESLLRTRAAQGRGPLLVRAEFEQHELAASHWNEAVAETEVDWLSAAREALRRTRHSDRQKCWQFLARKGFASEQIRAVLAEEQ